jgi:hypothetical protein
LAHHKSSPKPLSDSAPTRLNVETQDHSDIWSVIENQVWSKDIDYSSSDQQKQLSSVYANQDLYKSSVAFFYFSYVLRIGSGWRLRLWEICARKSS